jgi:hypothetical protein
LSIVCIFYSVKAIPDERSPGPAIWWYWGWELASIAIEEQFLFVVVSCQKPESCGPQHFFSQAVRKPQL